VGIDVTERELAKTAAERQERRFQALLQHMAEGVALQRGAPRPDGAPTNYRIEEVNPAIRRARRLQARGRDRQSLPPRSNGTPTAPCLDEFCG